MCVCVEGEGEWILILTNWGREAMTITWPPSLRPNCSPFLLFWFAPVDTILSGMYRDLMFSP